MVFRAIRFVNPEVPDGREDDDLPPTFVYSFGHMYLLSM